VFEKILLISVIFLIFLKNSEKKGNFPEIWIVNFSIVMYNKIRKVYLPQKGN